MTVQIGDPLGQALAEVAMGACPDPALCAELVEQVPQQTIALREFATVLTERLLEAARAADEPAETARLLNNLSNRLADLGHREQALTTINEAVTTYRTLADTYPEVFLPRLASSLHNLADCLATLGRDDEALAARDEAAGLPADPEDPGIASGHQPQSGFSPAPLPN